MALLLSWSGLVILPESAGNDPDIVLDRMVAAFNKLDPRKVCREAGSVIVVGGVFRLVSGSNLLVPIGKARIEATREANQVAVRYRLSFAELVVVVSIMVGCLPWMMRAGTEFKAFDIFDMAFIMTFMWVFLIGANIALTLVRFPRFVRQVGAEADATRVTP